jgi:hypothetical protein
MKLRCAADYKQMAALGSCACKEGTQDSANTTLRGIPKGPKGLSKMTDGIGVKFYADTEARGS